MRRRGRCSCLIRCCFARPIRHVVVGFPPNVKGRYGTSAEQVWTCLSARCNLCDQLMLVFLRTSARRAANTWRVTCAQIVGANVHRFIQNLKLGTRELSRCCGRMLKPGLDFAFHGVPDNALNSIQYVYVSFPLCTKYIK